MVFTLKAKRHTNSSLITSDGFKYVIYPTIMIVPNTWYYVWLEKSGKYYRVKKVLMVDEAQEVKDE